MLDPPNSVRVRPPLPSQFLTEAILDAAVEIIDLRVVTNAHAPHDHLAAVAVYELAQINPPRLLRSYMSWYNSHFATELRFHAINNIIGIAADQGRILNAPVTLIFPPMSEMLCYAINELMITHGGRARLHKQGIRYILWCTFDGTEAVATLLQVFDGVIRLDTWLRVKLYKPSSLLLFLAFLYFEDLNLTFR